jgi:uncharacterized protein (DUF433 family)
MQPAIIDRGPEIAGSRITVYDVLAETEAGAMPEDLAEWYQLDVAQIRSALDYIEEHREEVLRDLEAIRSRHARGNPPEVEQRRAGSRVRLEAVREDLRRRSEAEGNGHAGPCGGH